MATKDEWTVNTPGTACFPLSASLLCFDGEFDVGLCHYQSGSGSRRCAAEDEPMDRPAHRQSLGLRRRTETCQSTHQRGKDTPIHRLRPHITSSFVYELKDLWHIEQHHMHSASNCGLHNGCCCRLTSCWRSICYQETRWKQSAAWENWKSHISIMSSFMR